MAQPRKYLNDAERYKAYRDRKKERVEQMALDLRSLKRGGGTGKKRVATFAIGDDALKQGLLDLRKGIRARREEIQAHRRSSGWNPEVHQASNLPKCSIGSNRNWTGSYNNVALRYQAQQSEISARIEAHLRRRNFFAVLHGFFNSHCDRK
jgi:hypothetical protein